MIDEAGDRRVQVKRHAIERLCQANPYAINWEPICPATPRMIGLHPDYPNPKWEPNKANDLDQN